MAAVLHPAKHRQKLVLLAFHSIILIYCHKNITHIYYLLPPYWFEFVLDDLSMTDHPLKLVALIWWHRVGLSEWDSDSWSELPDQFTNDSSSHREFSDRNSYPVKGQDHYSRLPSNIMSGVSQDAFQHHISPFPVNYIRSQHGKNITNISTIYCII